MSDSPEPSVTRATATRSEFETRDGLRLIAEHHLLPHARARVVLLHGFAEHRDRYQELVEELLAAGYQCHLFDLRGHGESTGPRGHVSALSDYRDDLERFLEQAPSAPSGQPLPTVFLAHSLGGLIALDFLLHGKALPDALILSSPFFSPLRGLRRVAAAAVRLLSYLLPRFRLPAGIEPSELSRDAGAVEAYRSDPRVFDTLTAGWLNAVAQAQKEVFRRAGEVALPSLILVGTADTIAAPERTRAVFERLGSEDKTLLEYDGFRHEVLNEVGRTRVVADLLSWLAERFTETIPARPG